MKRDDRQGDSIPFYFLHQHSIDLLFSYVYEHFKRVKNSKKYTKLCGHPRNVWILNTVKNVHEERKRQLE